MEEVRVGVGVEEGGGVEVVWDGCEDKGGLQEMARRLEEIRELLSERDVESEREDGEKDGDGEKDEEMVVENEVTGAEVGEDGEAEKGADVEME